MNDRLRAVWHVVAATAVALSVAAGCDDDPGGDEMLPPACAEIDCGEHGRCELDVDREPICACDNGYTGDDCAQCAPGFTADGERCLAVVIDCSVDPSVCGQGVCVPGQAFDTCQCPAERTGRVCEQCAPGFQDHDDDGLCEASCAQSPCVAPQFCDDSSGRVQCLCPQGLTGSNCDMCDSGYVAVETDTGVTCRATCQALRCGGDGECSELGVEATCVCELGHTGPTCEACLDPRAELDEDGLCVVPDLDGPRLLALRQSRLTALPMLAVLDPTSGDLTPVEHDLGVGTGFTSDIAVHPETGLLYGASQFEVFSIDLEGGVERTIAMLPEAGITHAGPVLDPTGTTLYLAFADFTRITLAAVDIASGELTELGILPHRGLRTLTLDATGEALLVLAGDVLLAFDLASGTTTTRHEGIILPGGVVTEVWPSARIDDTLLMAAPSRSLARWSGDQCRSALRALGHAPAGWAEPTVVAMPRRTAADPVDPVVLTSDADADAPPLLVFAASADLIVDTPTEPLPIEIRSAHPDAVACIVSSGQPVALTVPAGTRLAHLVVVLEAAGGSTLTVDPGFELGAPQYAPIVLADDSSDLTLDLPDGIDAVYTDAGSLGFDARRTDYSQSADTLITLDLERGTLTQRPVAPLGSLGGLAWIP